MLRCLVFKFTDLCFKDGCECYFLSDAVMCLCVIQAFCFGQLRSSVWSAEHYQQTAQEREDTIFSQPGHNTAASVSRPR